MTDVATADVTVVLVEHDVSMDVVETNFLFGHRTGIRTCKDLAPTLAIGGRDVLVAQIRPRIILVSSPKMPVAGLTVPERLLTTLRIRRTTSAAAGGVRDFTFRIRRVCL
jgi:hypothetical protein